MSDPIWREDEGHVEEVISAPSEKEVTLWREEEGVPGPVAVAPQQAGKPDEHAAEELSAWPEGSVPARRQRKGRSGQRPSKKSSWKTRVAAYSLLLALVLVLGDLAYAIAGLTTALPDVRLAVQRSTESLKAGEIAIARRQLGVASDAADHSLRMSRRPSLVGLSALPVVGRDADALRTIGESSARIVRGIRAAAAGAAAMDLEDGGPARSLLNDGRVRFEILAKGLPFLETSEALLSQAQLDLQATDPRLERIRDVVLETERELDQGVAVVKKGRVFLSFLPSFLAEGSARKYLLVFQAPGEARATGGFAGLYGVLVVEDGEMSLREVGPFGEAVPAEFPAVKGPPWFEEAYGRQSALRQWQQANVSPNFPAVSKVWLRMFAAANGESLDGVIAMDPVAFADFLRATGPISDPSGAPLTDENAEKVLLHDSYVDFADPDRQSLFLSRLVESFWGKVQTGDFDPTIFGEALSHAVSTQHFKLYSVEDSEREQARVLGVDGWVEPGASDVQMVFNNNYGRNKIDYFLQRSVSSDIRILRNGDAAVTTSVELVNDAPSEPPSLLIGTGLLGPPPGVNRMTLNFLLPTGADVRRLEVDGAASPTLVYRDQFHPVVWDVLEVGPGETVRTSIDYVLPNAVTFEEGRGEFFSMTLMPQASVNEDNVHVEIAAPDGFTLTDPIGGVIRDPSTFVASGKLSAPLQVMLGLRPNDS